MILRQVTECSKALQFSPQANWPEVLPALAWRGALLSGFERADGPVIDWSEGSEVILEELLKAAYPRLGLGEASRLCALFLNHFSLDVTALMMRVCQFRWDEETPKVLVQLHSVSKKFHDWIDERQLNPRELAPIVMIEDPNSLRGLFDEIANRHFTKQNGIRSIEWAVDLQLSNGLVIDWTSLPLDQNEFVAALWKLRYPQTAARDEKATQLCDALNWPKKISGELQRVGDESLLKVQLTAQSKEDWQRRIEDLKKLSQQIENSDLWKN